MQNSQPAHLKTSCTFVVKIKRLAHDTTLWALLARGQPATVSRIMAVCKLSTQLQNYIRTTPKAELHIHVEGTLEPELMFKIAERNGITVRGTVESHKERRANFKVS